MTYSMDIKTKIIQLIILDADHTETPGDFDILWDETLSNMDKKMICLSMSQMLTEKEINSFIHKVMAYAHLRNMTFPGWLRNEI